MSTVDIQSAVLCDEVRREDNGKYLLIGVYSGGINFNSAFPTVKQRLFVFVVGRTEFPNINFRYRLIENSTKNAYVKGEAGYKINPKLADSAVKRKRSIEFNLPLGPCEFNHAGSFKVQINLGKRWKTLLEFSVSSAEKS